MSTVTTVTHPKAKRKNCAIIILKFAFEVKTLFDQVIQLVQGVTIHMKPLPTSTLQSYYRMRSIRGQSCFRDRWLVDSQPLLLLNCKMDQRSLLAAPAGRNETSFSNENLYTPVELFGIIAECEKLENPGEALLLKAKNLCWSILAMIAKNVGAAVEATNSLPANARTVTFHSNRKSAKRRRLMEPISVDSLALTESKMSTSSGGAKILGVIAKEEREKQAGEDVEASADTDDMAGFLSRMVAALSVVLLGVALLETSQFYSTELCNVHLVFILHPPQIDTFRYVPMSSKVFRPMP
ncbi:Spatacsin C-terminal domain-containing protein [Forsythia ovata]|uniref:Spatacsin C-terminal domain-containing protein n=1 Tax=Forsythia ovata TaxID=205694 RepID=A0ABD1WX07_9LAMI